MSQRVKRKDRLARQRGGTAGPWRIRCGPGELVYISPTEPMRFETQEAAERQIREANWEGMHAVLAGPGTLEG